MELDRLLWRERKDLQIKQLWEMLCTYCYLPRLADYGVLEAAIRQGLTSSEFFGIADGVGEDRYLNLTLGKARASINQSDFLVKPAVAEEQIEREAEEQARKTFFQTGEVVPVPVDAPVENGAEGASHPKSHEAVPEPYHEQMPTSFTMSAKLDNTRVNRDVRTIMEEIVSQLEQLDGAEVKLTLEVRAAVDAGIPVPTQRTVSENCNTLHIANYRFDA